MQRLSLNIMKGSTLKALWKIKTVDLSDMARHSPTQTKSLVVLCDHLVFDKVLPLVKYNGTQSNLKTAYVCSPADQMTKRRTRNGSIA